MWRKLFALTLTLQLGVALQSQNMYNTIARDTIIAIPSFAGHTYWLDGKKLNLPVMDFFMTDYPIAHDEIRLAILTDQVALMGYSIGGLFGLTGLLVHRQDADLGGDLLQLGGISVGSGILFHIFSGAFKRKAVRIYNQEIKQLYKTKDKAGLHLEFAPNGVKLGWTFE